LPSRSVASSRPVAVSRRVARGRTVYARVSRSSWSGHTRLPSWSALFRSPRRPTPLTARTRTAALLVTTPRDRSPGAIAKGHRMNRRSLHHLLTVSVLTSATILAFSTRATLQSRTDDRQDRGDQRRGHDDDDDDDRGGRRGVILPTGQFVTPTIIEDAVQQYLNPGLPAYPNFVAGEAVRSQLSPGGSTLAGITPRPNPA